MKGFYFNLLNRRDLQDLLDTLDSRFPEETEKNPTYPVDPVKKNNKFESIPFSRVQSRKKSYMVIQKDQVKGIMSILSPSLNPSRQGREVNPLPTWAL